MDPSSPAYPEYFAIGANDFVYDTYAHDAAVVHPDSIHNREFLSYLPFSNCPHSFDSLFHVFSHSSS